jgi:basic membrane protein A
MAAEGRGQVRIGLVLEQPSVKRGSDPFQYGAYRGLLRAAHDLHVQAKAVSPSPIRANQYAALFSSLARQRYDLVIGVGFSELPALSQAAHKFSHVKFGLLDARSQDIKPAVANAKGTVFHTEEASYLAGFIAARMADRGPRPHVISSVGGVDIPPVKATSPVSRQGRGAPIPRSSCSTRTPTTS